MPTTNRNAIILESTYRLQFHSGFTFLDATQIVPYLHDLGITHVYASPYLKASAGSMHGYDVIDHRVLNSEIGTPAEHDAFVNALQDRGMGLILDIVPNHMGIATTENPWWESVLENGPASPYADYFDIAWNDTARPELRGKVLLPVLGEPYGQVLETGQLRLAYENGSFRLHYCARSFPISTCTLAPVLALRSLELIRQMSSDDADLTEYQSILTSMHHLPKFAETDPLRWAEREREQVVIKRRLADLTARNEVILNFIDATISTLNGKSESADSFDLLDDILSRQPYRLAFWRVALDEINYRRFFDVNDLAALNVERDAVFSAVHATIFQFLADGKVDGLRVDHPDGLYDPQQYFERLQQEYRKSCTIAADALPLYVIVEKILGTNELLPANWVVAGTTGYDFLNTINGLFVDATAEKAFTHLYRDRLDDYAPFADVVYRSKKQMLLGSLASELNMLAHNLDHIAQRRRQSRDFTLNGLRDALGEVIVCFPVYRSYITPAGVSAADRKSVEVAIRRAIVRNPLLSEAVFRFIRDMLFLEYPNSTTDAEKVEQQRFAGKFQQVTGPVMAKGLEDTSFYIYNRLVSLNEVGGNPAVFGTKPEAVHQMNANRQAKYPRALSALSTHDTKRCEDVRARISVLSEMPDEWAASVRRWAGLNEHQRTIVYDAPVPDANEEYLLYQTLLGAWPPMMDEPDATFIDRIADYSVKALHEAKVHSSWVNPNADYDAAMQKFIRRILDPISGRPFLNDFRSLRQLTTRCGAINTLAQTLLKITAPGVPDTYQGTELPDFSLVDPDNRRPVDYQLRTTMLNHLRDANASELATTLEDGRAKLYLTWRALTLRREYPGLFAEGEYIPLPTSGAKAEHVFAFARRTAVATAIVVVPRLSLNRGKWADTRVSLVGLDCVGKWQDRFTHQWRTPEGDGFAIGDLLAEFPVSLLIRSSM